MRRSRRRLTVDRRRRLWSLSGRNRRARLRRTTAAGSTAEELFCVIKELGQHLGNGDLADHSRDDRGDQTLGGHEGKVVTHSCCSNEYSSTDPSSWIMSVLRHFGQRSTIKVFPSFAVERAAPNSGLNTKSPYIVRISDRFNTTCCTAYDCASALGFGMLNHKVSKVIHEANKRISTRVD